MSENINDKIVHHLCSQFLLFPILEKKIIIIFMFLKCDVHKFFYSIDHNCLMEKMKKIYLDEEILKLLKEIINSTNEEYVNQKIEKTKNEKEEAVLNQKFEKAAELRDTEKTLRDKFEKEQNKWKNKNTKSIVTGKVLEIVNGKSWDK